MKNIQQQLLGKVKQKEKREAAGVREQGIYALVENNPGISSGEIAEKLKIPNSTVKRILSDLVSMRNLIVHGAGRGTSYSIAATDLIKRDVTIRLTNKERMKEITLGQLGSFLQIKKIVFTPLFEWTHPDEWATKLSMNGLYLIINAITSKCIAFRQPYSIVSYNRPSYFQPVLLVEPNIVLPDQLRSNGALRIDYPIRCSIELSGSVNQFDFDVMLITDEG
ncbi:MAG: winged helix-turn-helix domain-containing protein [Ferruginibacter sp.]